MTFLTTLLLEATYYGVTLGYPAYQVYLANKHNKVERLWILYFFIFGIFNILESTLLWPVKYVLNLIFCCGFCYIKFFLALWLLHPSYRGALLLEQKGGKYLDLAYEKVFPIAGKVLAILGVPERQVEK